MRNELKHIEQIENYLLGKLNNVEKTSFEFELNNNIKLQEEVDSQKKIMERLAVLAFIGDVQSFHPEFIASENSGGGKFKWFLNSIIVIIVAGITSLGFYFSSANENKKTKDNRSQSKKIIEKQDINTNTLLALNNTSNTQYNPISISKNLTTINHLHNKAVGNNIGNLQKNPTVIEPSDDLIENEIQPNDTNQLDKKTYNKDLFNCLQVPFEEAKIQAHQGGTIITKNSKSKITFAPGIMQFANGKPVYGEVIIKYREFRDVSDMAFSKIPMTHEMNGEEYLFNSAGMFEIRAYQNGKEVEISPGKTFTVDYNVTEKLDSCYFWSLNDKSQKWTLLDTLKYAEDRLTNRQVRDVDFFDRGRVFGRKYLSFGKRYGILTGSIKDNVERKERNLSGSYSLYKRRFIFFYRNANAQADFTDSNYVFYNVKRGNYRAVIDDENYSDMKVQKVKVKKNKVTELDFIIDLKKNQDLATYKTNYELKLTDKSTIDFYNELTNDSMPLQPNFVGEAYFDAGHYTPNLVQGLKCANFGTYNCDAVGRLKQPTQVRASYTNEIGEEIKPKTKAALSLIDLKQNAAFSFNPKNFTCSATGRNVILLFNEDKVYAVPEEEFKNMNIKKTGDYTFKLKDITDEIKSSKDLKKYLGL